MADYRRHEVISGLFITLAVLVFALFAFKVGDVDLFGFFRGDSLTCKAYFTDIRNLRKGALVKVGGQAVGKVKGVRMVERALTAEQVKYLQEFYETKKESGLQEGMKRQLIEVVFELTDPSLKLNPGAARVILNQESPLAPHFLELDPGEWASDRELATIFEADLGDEVTIAVLEGTGFESIVASIKPTVQELKNLLARLNREIFTSRNAEHVAAALRDLAETMEDARKIASGVESFLDRNLEPNVEPILEGLVGATRNLRERVGEVQRSVQEFFAGASGVVTDNRAEIAEVVRRLRRTMWEAEMAVRKIKQNPAFLLFGDEETDLEALRGDDSWLRYSGRAGPYEQRDETDASQR